ncbi:MAG: helix-turn-helix transcriptional regulator [Clostridia bacterium]|nr:helix-turn-helix transcriptional regulator [Clostridia bacterium]
MDDLKQIVAKNITELRKKHGITQAELAERLNYSDKAVSKWERGESIPDVAVLKIIAEIFSVKIDYLVTEEHADDSLEIPKISRRRARNQMLITAMSLMLVWLIATFIFVNIELIAPHLKNHWMVFVYAVPVTCIVWLVLNTLWFNPKRNFLIISLLLWSTLAVLYLSFFSFLHTNAWLLFLIGIPSQIIVLLWSGIRPSHKQKQKTSTKKRRSV